MVLPSQLAFCLLAVAAALCILQAQGRENTALDCCTGISGGTFPITLAHRIRSYIIQGPQMGCPLQAIVLITKRGRELCFRPDDANALQIVQILNSRRTRKLSKPRRA